MNLREKYFKQTLPELMKNFHYRNRLSAPKIEKVIINVGLNKSAMEKNSQYIDLVKENIAKISGQRPVINLAKKSISGFKIRQGIPVGISTTLRGAKMYDFLEKLINIALPRVRDFRGLEEKSFDEQGNLSIGFREQIAFPEINQDNIEKVHGLQVVISIKAANKQESLALLKLLGFPFREKNIV